MGVEKCELFYDSSSVIYYAGQTVSGFVGLTLNSPKKYQKIVANYLGEANVYWKQGSGRTTHHYRNHESYYRISQDLSASESGEEMELPAGKHKFPFSFILPSVLPTSFEGRYGHIRYSIKIVIKRPWRFDQQYKFLITVLSEYDLNKYPRLKNPILDEVTKTFCCLCCASQKFQMNVQLPCLGFAPGQIIPIKVDCFNKSNKEILYVEFALVKIITYRAAGGRTKVETKDVAECLSPSGIKSGQDITFIQKLTVPSIPPSELHNCHIIDTVYSIKVKAKVGGFARSPRASIPIQIGTTPIFEMVDRLNVNVFNSIPPPTRSEALPPNRSGALLPNRSEDPPSYSEVQNSPAANGPSAYNMPPPSYEESQYQANRLQGDDDDEYTNMQTKNYAPRYPVYTFPSAPSE